MSRCLPWSTCPLLAASFKMKGGSLQEWTPLAHIQEQKASQVVRVALLFTAFPVWITVAKSNRKAVLPKNVQTTQTTPTPFGVPQLHSSFQEHISVCLASKQSLAAAGKVSPTRMPLEEGHTGLKTYVSIFFFFFEFSLVTPTIKFENVQLCN